MNKPAIFICGFFTGVLVLLIGVIIAYNSIDTNAKEMYEQNTSTVETEEYIGDCISSMPASVISVLDNGDALATIEDGKTPLGLTILLEKDPTNPYYDDKIVSCPDGKCFRQVGTFTYESKFWGKKTVPVVRIM